MEGKIAFLVYSPWRQARRKNDSFDGLSNLGAYMLKDVLNRNRIDCDFCSVDSAHLYDVVLVSFTSHLDMLAFASIVIRHPHWQKGKRKFIVIGGGFGMQNPMSIKDYLDYGWFGRGENNIVEIVKNPREFEHESYMDVNNPKITKVAQSEKVYPFQFDYPNTAHGKEAYRETIQGCPNKCFYCHYSWVRKHHNTGNHFNLSLYVGSQELDMFNLEMYRPTCAQLTVGLDGYSERLRKIVNRHNTNEDIENFIIGVSEKTQIKGKSVFLRLYNIIGYETETPDDFYEFKDLIQRIQPRIKKRILLTTHNTPLRPSTCTPMAYAAIQSTTHLRRDTGKPVIPETENLMWFNSRFDESDYARFEYMLIERFTEQYRELFTLLATTRKFNTQKTSDKWFFVNSKYNLTDLYREYDINEDLPTWFLEGYMPQGAIRKLRLQMKRKQGIDYVKKTNS